MLVHAIRCGPAAARQAVAASSRRRPRCPRSALSVAAALQQQQQQMAMFSSSTSSPPQPRIVQSSATTTNPPKKPHSRALTIFEDPTIASHQTRLYDADCAPCDPDITVLRTVDQIRAWTAHPINNKGTNLALVPTMGALHQGHLDLVRAAASAGHWNILVSIYVNPAQFGLAEDLDSYPATWDADCAALSALRPELEDILTAVSGAKPPQRRPLSLAIFAPTTRDMYPSGPPGQAPDSNGSFVTITPAGAELEGRTRPTFFRGVATACLKLFNIAQPARAFFGQKDIQQTVVVRQLVRDFHLPLDVAVVPTTREEKDGLALSSRNVYLGPRRRAVAPVLVRALRAGEAACLEAGEREAGAIVPAALAVILQTLEEQSRLPPSEGVMFELDYISLRDPDTFAELKEVDPAKGAILCGAIKMLPVYEAKEGEDLGQSGGPPVRLIDNLVLPPIPEKKGPSKPMGKPSNTGKTFRRLR